MKKTMNKTTKNNFINYGIVIAIFVIVEILSPNSPGAAKH